MSQILALRRLATVKKADLPSTAIDGRNGRPLEALGLVQAWDVGGSRKKHYTLTPLGRQVLDYGGPSVAKLSISHINPA